MVADEVKKRINFDRLGDHLADADVGSKSTLIDVVRISNELETALKRLDDGAKSQKYTGEYAVAESRRLRQEATAQVRPKIETAETLAALADVTDDHLSPERVLRRARFEPAVGGDDTNRRLLAETVNELKVANVRAAVGMMDGDELAHQVIESASTNDFARLNLLHERIMREGSQHVSDRGWSRAKSALMTAMATVRAGPDHEELAGKAHEIRECALDTLAYGELIRSGQEPTRLRMRRVMGNLEAGKTALSEGAPLKIGSTANVTMTPNS